MDEQLQSGDDQNYGRLLLLRADTAAGMLGMSTRASAHRSVRQSSRAGPYWPECALA